MREAWITERGVGGDTPDRVGRDELRDMEDMREAKQFGDNRDWLKR